MKTFHFGVAQLDQTEGLDEIGHPIQRRFHHRLARAGGGKTQNRALPEFLIATLRDRYVELFGNPRLNTLQNPALAF